MGQACPIQAIGCTAHRALQRSDGIVTAVAHLARGSYGYAAGELVWIGNSAAMHPRAIVIEGGWDFSPTKRLRAGTVRPWRPAAPRFDADAAGRARARCAVLRGDVARLGDPSGFAAMLTGGRPAFPMDGAASKVLSFARALGADSVKEAYEAALPLLGLGCGLTPCGDDLVGAALFARLAAPAARPSTGDWQRAAAKLADEAGARSNRISAALFADLVAGRTFSPLHRLAEALAGDEDHQAVLQAARSLVQIGNSSGWDMLTGFIAGLTGGIMFCEEVR